MHRRLHLVGGGAELPGAQFVDIADELALISRVRGLAAEVVGPVENAGRAAGPCCTAVLQITSRMAGESLSASRPVRSAMASTAGL